MTKIPFRQGDVALSPVTIPSGLPAKRVTSVVLALGEVTGHSHVLSAPAIEEMTDGRDPELARRFVRVLEEGGVLAHQEHGAIPIPPGDYEIIRQREYAPESTRFVAD